MIAFEKFTLSNGLKVIVHQDPTSCIAVMNLLYCVGSKDENPLKTGLAHLVEHLMFSGSCHIPTYDACLQRVGGDSNAYTTVDVTNYYCTLPAGNLETAFWLESDRMLGLAFDERSLDIQKKVVIEEFKERYINQPYGEVWHHLTDMAYHIHPYKWPTIGKKPAHIAQVVMQDIKAFFYKFYRPNNAVLVLTGNITYKAVEQFCKKWFEPIPAGLPYQSILPKEPQQKAPKRKVLKGDVPMNRIYKAYHMPGRVMADYYPALLLCNLLGEGNSSLLYKQLVLQQELYTTIEVYTTDFLDSGLLVITGNLKPHITFDQAEAALLATLKDIEQLTDQELQKVKNHIESQYIFAQVDLMNRAQGLAFATILGDTNLINSDIEYMQQVQLECIQSIAHKILCEQNCTTIHYKSVLSK